MVYNIKTYQSKLSNKVTQVAIKYIKDTFQYELSSALNLQRVSAPLFVKKDTGLNDDLNGVERKVSFTIKDIKGEEIEIVQSLAKWKRYALKQYNFSVHEGLYTDMNAIRRDEDLDNLHSVYVDQWDWEKIIDKKDRELPYLFKTVEEIFTCLKNEEKKVNERYRVFKNKLPENIFFISTSELESLYPDLSRKEREDKLAREKKAFFLYQIGWPLKDGKSHDGRAADYDDYNLNGDIILYNEILDKAFEVSSMGIRVDEISLLKQLEYKGELYKKDTPFCQGILNKDLPYTIGGGIGQSRLCMFFLEKAHIGEIQASLWSEEDIQELKKMNINLL
ncbi:MAG: aspartate--ammonia ligase [Candidatus Enterosoma sp.]|nr:aspartate--ammonia ligase [Bacilli bacterium]MDY3907152.1 aspartate--ammonia ligase [Candidatus Enterosoma sp.]MDY5649942.1 aspartate--ammonia ligase [Candidatus Enterosoma sp.]